MIFVNIPEYIHSNENVWLIAPMVPFISCVWNTAGVVRPWNILCDLHDFLCYGHVTCWNFMG